jgi:tetratricopeptide (TPR) repeat protein
MSGWQVSAGDLAEWARPVLFAAAALASVWVFRDARGRAEFGWPSVSAWTLLALLFPPAALPLYLAARLYTRRDDAKEGEGETVEDVEGVEAGSDSERPRPRRRLAPTLLYTAALIIAGAAYFYADYRSFDARLARAERAKLYQRPDEAIREYRAALRVRDDAHTRKLLGLMLLQTGRADEALAELLTAARAGDGEEALHFHTAEALSALDRHAEAAARYQHFLDGPACAPPSREEKCEAARARLNR